MKEPVTINRSLVVVHLRVLSAIAAALHDFKYLELAAQVRQCEMFLSGALREDEDKCV